jgi:hypothetical protein
VGTDELGLRRVVVYRNGVGYFERAGRVSDDAVSFRMRQRMVGDFLASLAVIEQGGGSVRSASFPLDVEDADAPPAPEPPGMPPGPGGPLPRPLVSHGEGDFAPEPSPKRPAPDPEKMRDVILHLDGKQHDLAIGYLAETPVWRPSYRVVIADDGSADLQAWGIVQNLSGEDWSGVSLSLVAGAPLAFQSTLGTPVIPQRPVVTDEGEVVAAMPTGVTSLEDRGGSEPPRRYGPEDGYGGGGESKKEAAEDEDAAPEESQAMGAVAKPRPLNLRSSYDAPPAAAPMPPPPPPSPPRRVSDLAAVALEAGSTRYELPYPVTIPNESATMVLLTSQRVPAEAVLLYAPESGVSDSGAHPFRVARFQNATQGLLERGPIAVFEKGAFLGQGLLEPLPPRATATVPFALERSVALSSSAQHDEQASRLYRIESARLWVERDAIDRVTYRIENGGDKAAKLLVKHPRVPGTRLYKPPPGTEDNTGSGSALIPIALAAHGKSELVVEERRGVQRYVDWLDPSADEAVAAYIADARADRAVADKLKAAWSIRAVLKRAVDEMNGLGKERNELERQSQETRSSLRAIEKNPQAADLRARLTARLDEAGKRLDTLTKRGIELQLSISENEIRFRDAVQDIALSSGLPPKE